MKNKRKNKQKERWQGHRNSCGQLQRGRILIKKLKHFIQSSIVFRVLNRVWPIKEC